MGRGTHVTEIGRRTAAGKDVAGREGVAVEKRGGREGVMTR